MDEKYYGKDYPVGMVQIEFVGCDPKTKCSEYGWKPVKSTFLEVYVDGKRFRIDVGDVLQSDGTKRRGLHICGDIGIEVNHHSINAVDVLLESKAQCPDGAPR